MADRRNSVRPKVALLTNHDLIYQSRRMWIIDRKPGNAGARQVTLKAFEERHEIPNGKDVVFHKQLQMGDRIDLRVDRVCQQQMAEVIDTIGVVSTVDQQAVVLHHVPPRKKPTVYPFGRNAARSQRCQAIFFASLNRSSYRL